MADHYVSLNPASAGFKYSDFSTGTASNTGNLIELRVRDGAGLSKKGVVLALKAYERFFENAQQVSAAGFDVKG